MTKTQTNANLLALVLSTPISMQVFENVIQLALEITMETTPQELVILLAQIPINIRMNLIIFVNLVTVIAVLAKVHYRWTALVAADPDI